jgi:hypothetical protein
MQFSEKCCNDTNQYNLINSLTVSTSFKNEIINDGIAIYELLAPINERFTIHVFYFENYFLYNLFLKEIKL